MTYAYSFAENHFESLCKKAITRPKRKVTFADQEGFGNLVVHARKRRPRELLYDVTSESVWDDLSKYVFFVQMGMKFRVRLKGGKYVILRLHSAWRKRKTPINQLADAFVLQRYGDLVRLFHALSEDMRTQFAFITANLNDVSARVDITEKMIKRQDLGYSTTAEEIGQHQVQRHFAKRGRYR